MGATCSTRQQYKLKTVTPSNELDTYCEFRLSYVSRGSRQLPPAEIEDIVQISVKNNHKLGITGALVSCSGLFLQTLEGDYDLVMQLYKKLEKDPRHKDLVIISSERAPQNGPLLVRKYRVWAMKNINLGLETSLLSSAVNSLVSTVIESHYVIGAYTQQSVMKMMQEGLNPLHQKPQQTHRVILFCDIVGYSTLTENYTQEKLYRVLNRYLEICSDTIAFYGGEAEKLIGDCLMASFSASECLTAVKCASDIILSLERCRELEPDMAEIYTGVGLACGEVIRANFGGTSKKDYTLIGNCVNVASRLESETRSLGYSILFDKTIGDQVEKHLPTRPLGQITVKGKREPVEVCTLTDEKFRFPSHLVRYSNSPSFSTNPLKQYGNSSQRAIVTKTAAAQPKQESQKRSIPPMHINTNAQPSMNSKVVQPRASSPLRRLDTEYLNNQLLEWLDVHENTKPHIQQINRVFV